MGCASVRVPARSQLGPSSSSRRWPVARAGWRPPTALYQSFLVNWHAAGEPMRSAGGGCERAMTSVGGGPGQTAPVCCISRRRCWAATGRRRRRRTGEPPVSMTAPRRHHAEILLVHKLIWLGRRPPAAAPVRVLLV